MLAPIVLFVYNRPEHTINTLKSLKANDLAVDSELFIFSDGPKDETGFIKVKEIRKIINNISGFKNVNVIERESNFGLRKSIIDGVTSVVNKYGKVIVLEDDLVLSPYFLKFMNEALDKYEEEERVMQISGFMYDVDLRLEEDALFLPMPTAWGWATWKRAWKYFSTQKDKFSVLSKDKKMKRNFNLDNSYYFFDLLVAQRCGKINSWGIEWNLDLFMLGGLTLYPKKSLVFNNGFDGSGTNCGSDDLNKNNFIFSQNNYFKFPNKISDSNLKSVVFKTIKIDYGNDFRDRIVRKLKKIINKI